MGSNQFRVIVGSYEHNILCLSLDLSLSKPLFTPIFHFQAHSLSVRCLDVSKRYLVSGSNDEHIRIYDLQKRKELGTLLAHQGSVTSLRFSRSNNSEGIAEANGEHSTLEGTQSGNKWLVSAAEDGKLILWRVRDWENFGTMKGHVGRINDVDIHPSNRVAVSCGEDHTVRLWNLMTVKKAAVLKLKKYSQNGQFVRWLGAQGDHFIVALLNKVLIFQTASAKVVKEIDLKSKTIMQLEVQEIDGKSYVVVGLGDGSVAFYNSEEILGDAGTEDMKPAFELRGHSSRVKDLCFYKNEHGLYLVTVGSDGRVVVWDAVEREQLAVYDTGERLTCLTVCPESVEKYDSMKKRHSEVEAEQSEVESDTEEVRKVMFGKKNKRKKKQKVTVEVE